MLKGEGWNKFAKQKVGGGKPWRGSKSKREQDPFRLECINLPADKSAPTSTSGASTFADPPKPRPPREKPPLDLASAPASRKMRIKFKFN